ncbi:MAG: NADH-quinone oxidoreductase subunit N [Armatimonadetes bacterium]|nr:NADH-quinone oxidoreductase subunit N [Armatimonadota bacterium]
MNLEIPRLDVNTLKVLAPHLALGLGMVVAMLLETLRDEEAEDRPLIVSIAPFFSLGALAFLLFAPIPPEGLDAFGEMIVLDGWSRGVWSAILLALTVVLLCAHRELEKHRISFVGEYYALLMGAGLGMLILSGSGNLIMAFLGLELLSLALYLLCIFFPQESKSQESGMKYFILSSAASAVMLYGMALIYGASGSTWFTAIARTLREDPTHGGPLLAVGAVLLAAGLAFKISAVPFHMWTPDVYEGAPTSTTAFMSVGTKAAALAAIVRLFGGALWQVQDLWVGMFWVLALLSILVGNMMAMVQQRVKRMLAYSGIAHAGYLLLGPLVATERAYVATAFYLIVYAFMNAGAFLALMAVEIEEGEPVTMDSLRGLAARNPFVAVCLAVCLISLAGLPPTGGFLAKFYLFGAALPTQGLLVILGILGSFFGAYYYLGTLLRIFSAGDRVVPAREEPEAGSSLSAALAVAVAGVLVTGMIAQPLLDWLMQLRMQGLF